MNRRNLLKSAAPAAGVILSHSILAAPCRPGLALDGATPPILGCGGGASALMPDWNDENAAYAARGLNVTGASADINDAGYSQGNISRFTDLSTINNTHNDTEGDFLWTAYQMYKRLDGIRQAAADNWFTRSTNLANWFKNDYVNGTAWNNDQNHDHFYGWGLCDWAEGENDSAALATVDQMVAEMSAWFGTGGPMPTFPGNDISSQGNFSRRWARQLRFAVAAQRVSPSTANQTWRDKVIDIVMDSPNWVASHNVYAMSQTSTGGAGFDYASGDRSQITFHMGIWMDGMWHALIALEDEGDPRAPAVRQRLIDMATFYRDQGLDFGGGESGGDVVSQFQGRNIQTGAILRGGNDGAPDGVYTVCPINGLVFGYKLTGDQTYLDRAWEYWNAWQGGVGLGGTPGTIHHYTDSRIASATGFELLAYNKGELQYVYALFENGGNPALV